jgi:hypothetical protein
MRIEERLELAKEKIQTDTFLSKKGTVGEIAFYIFDYPPEKEMMIRETIQRWIFSLNKKSIHIFEIDLYNLCLEILEEELTIEKVIEFEKNKGSDELFNKLKPILKAEVIKNVISEKIKDEEIDIIFLTGVGKVWPLVRSHEILNNLQSVITQFPLVLFYPGKYSGNDLSLFGRFMDSNYYRAFRLIDDDPKKEVLK